jgi:hypothetical protein
MTTFYRLCIKSQPHRPECDENFEIFIFDDTGTFTQITNSTNEVGVADAKISGDGSHIVYIRDQGTALNPQRIWFFRSPGGHGPVIAANVNTVALTYGRAISEW